MSEAPMPFAEIQIMRTMFYEGWRDGLTLIIGCPYPEGTPQAYAWTSGYLFGRKQLIEQAAEAGEPN